MVFEDVAEVLRAHPQGDLGEGATDDEISRAETDLGVVFPESYRRFLRDFGWAGVSGHFELFGLGPGVPRHLYVVGMTRSERSDFMPPTPHHLIPVLNDGGGNLYCLDTARDNGEDCPVVRQDHESGELSEVSSSFISWLAEEISSATQQD